MCNPDNYQYTQNFSQFPLLYFIQVYFLLVLYTLLLIPQHHPLLFHPGVLFYQQILHPPSIESIPSQTNLLSIFNNSSLLLHLSVLHSPYTRPWYLFFLFSAMPFPIFQSCLVHPNPKSTHAPPHLLLLYSIQVFFTVCTSLFSPTLLQPR